jgi:hypothetical protein
MPPPELHQSDDIDAIVAASVRQTLLQIGLVTTSDADMRETQKDFAYLRDLRIGSSAMKSKGVLAVIGIIVTALATLIWLGLNALFHAGGTPPVLPH